MVFSARSRRLRAAFLAAIVLVVGACARDGGPPGASGTAPPSATTPDRVDRPGPRPDTAPAAAESLPRRDRLQRQIALDGVTKERAIELFSLAVGPLPGAPDPADEPADAGDADDATLPILYLSGVWAELDDAQRDEAAKLLGWDERSPAPSGVIEVKGAGEATSRPAGSTPAPGSRFAPSTFTDSTGAVIDADYLAKMATTQMGAIGALVGRGIPGFKVRTYGLALRGEVHAETTKWHRTLTSPLALEPYEGGLCNIDAFLPNFQGQTPTVNASIMAHEVFHCFQFNALGTLAAAQSAGQWLMEGGATWAMLMVVPFARGELPKVDRKWDGWSLHPEIPLFERTYDAVGFFGHVGDVQGSQASLWPLMLPAVVASSGRQNVAAFDVLVGGQQRETLDSWGASYFRFTDKKGWDMTGPGGVDRARVSAARQSVAPRGDIVLEGADAWAVQNVELSSDADIVKIRSTNGNVRLLDGPHQRQSTFSPHSDINYCLKGACTCPDGSPGFDEQTVPAKAPLHIALTGGHAGAAGYAQGYSLDDFCQNRPRPAPPTPPGGGGGGGGNGNDDDVGVPGLDNPKGRSKGDPHLITFDGHSYGFQAVGEYILARSTTDDFEVQVRQEPIEGRRDVSVNTAVATRVGGARLTMTLEAGRVVLRIDDAVVDDDFRAIGRDSVQQVTTSLGNGFVVEWDDGTLLEVLPIGTFGLNVHLVPAPERADRLEGLLGDFDGDAENDLTVRGGARRVDQFSRAELYADFRPSWMVSGATSLFDYAPGEDTSSFDDPTFPDELIDPRNVPGRAEAEARCRQAGITDAVLLDECAVDVALTGKSAFLTGYAVISRTITADGGATTGSANLFEGEVRDRGEQPEHRFEATEGDVLWVGGAACEDAGMPTRLIGPDGAQVSVRPGCLLGRIVVPATGTYRLQMNIFQEKTGRYRLPIEPVRHDRTADVHFGDELTGTIEHRAAHDVYRLAARSGDVLSITVPDCAAGPNAVAVAGSDGSLLSTTAGCQATAVTLPRDGTYTITVNSGDDGGGAYRLPLRKR